MKRHRLCAAILTGVVILLILLTVYQELQLNSVITINGKDIGELSYDNEPHWKGIPGEYGIDIDWKHYMYNCTNFEDVVFRGVEPEFMEYGPYIYSEDDEYQNIVYEEAFNPATG